MTKRNDSNGQVRFVGAFAGLEVDLRSAEMNGRIAWCNTLRDLHEGDLAARAPFEMLKQFAAGAPSELLNGYVLGMMYVRENPDDSATMTAAEWIARAGQLDQADQVGVRGMALGCAFMLGGPEIATLH